MSDEPAPNDPRDPAGDAATTTGGGVAVADAPDLDLGYQVAIEAFSGPLDLLLYLVRRAQVDIADIPVALIADQFIATVGAWQDLDLDVAGDFILMAATLLEIKSRLVTPPRVGEEEEDEPDEELFDPRTELIQQLLAFRRFKDAPLELARLEREQVERCPRQLRESIPEDTEEAETWSLDNADPYLLFRAWEQVMAKIAGLGPRRVVYDDVPMEERMGALIQTMSATREARLSWLMERMPTTVAKVGMLVALLECTRQRYVETIQHEQYGEVYLRFREEAERNAQPALPPEPVDEPAKRRRRRAPLVTFVAPRPSEDDSADADDAALDDEPEEVVETDEQRFVRELNETCRVDAVLERGADLEAGLAAFMIEKQARDEAAAIAQAEADERAKAEAAAAAERDRLAAEGRERRKAEAAAARRAERERRQAERDAAKAGGGAASEGVSAGDAPVAAQEPAASDVASPADAGPRPSDPDADARAGQPL